MSGRDGNDAAHSALGSDNQTSVDSLMQAKVFTHRPAAWDQGQTFGA